MSQYGPDRVASICGIETGHIESLAHLYATTRPALIRANYGLQRVRGGGMAMRNIACLPALVGAFREAAGGILVSTSGNFTIDNQALSRPDLLAGRTPRTVNMSTIGRALDDTAAPIRAVIVYNSNPRGGGAGFGAGGAGFAREDLFTVVLEHFQTTRRTMRDIVLPATTQLEHLDVVKPYGHYDMVANNPAIGLWGRRSRIRRSFDCWPRPWDFPSLFDDSDEAIARSAIAEDWDFDAVRAQGWKRIGAAKGVARLPGAGSTPRRARWAFSRRRNRSDWMRFPTISSRSRYPQRARAPLAARDDLSARAQFSQQQLC